MNDQQSINSSENNMVKSKKNKETIILEIILIIIAISALLFTVRLFKLSKVDVRGCDGIFGNLSGDCMSTTYSLWGFFSLFLTSLSILSAFAKEIIASIVGSLLFLIFNILLWFITSDYGLKAVTMECIIFSGILFIVEMSVVLYILTKTDKK